MTDNPAGFSGATFVREVDEKRLTDQLKEVYRVMRDGQWRTVDELAGATQFLNSRSLEAQLRNLRKPQFGGHDPRLNPDGHMVLRRNRNGKRGFSEYRLMLCRDFKRPDQPASLMEAYEQELKRQETASKNRSTIQTDLFRGNAA